MTSISSEMDDSIPAAAPAELRPAERPFARFLITLLANGVKAGLSFLTGLIVARGLGASGYGDLSFLLGSFTAINSILDAGSSFAFYTLLSGRRRGRTFFLTYFAWTFGMQFCGSLLLIALVAPDAFVRWMWLGHGRSVVLLAFAASFMLSQTWNAVSLMGEASRKTLVVQTGAAIQAAAHLLLILLAVRGGWLTAPAVLGLMAIEYLILALILGPRVLKAGYDREAHEPVSAVIREFVQYCKPLLVYVAVAFFYQYADRWLLQRYGGAAQTGYFSVGQQFANLSLLATTSVLNVFWKEVAAARSSNDPERANELFRTVQAALFAFAAFVSCLFVPHTRELLRWTLGRGFEGAGLAVALLFLYPVHQTAGQMQSTFYLATGDTRLYSVMGIVFMLISIPVTYFMLAPGTAALPGLGMGAVGIAIKMVVLQIVGIGVQTWVINRVYKTRAPFWSQLVLLGALLATAFGAKWIAGRVLPLDIVALNGAALGDAARLALSSALYAGAVVLAVWRFPLLAGVSKERARQVLGSVRGLVRR